MNFKSFDALKVLNAAILLEKAVSQPIGETTLETVQKPNIRRSGTAPSFLRKQEPSKTAKPARVFHL